jgi:serine/threonine-protein kinase
VTLPTSIGRYEVLGELATGGMAEILLGRVTGPSGFERPVVIKRILPHLARQKPFVAMFLDEARIVAQIRHPNVVHVQELAQDGAELYLVMEYLEGESLAGVVKRLLVKQRSIPGVLAAHIVAEACSGLHAAHELRSDDGAPQNLVHRDVSPQNVFVTYQGQVKVIDFGVAKAADRIARTEAGQVKGKFEYMAPEQVRGEPIDRRTDVFALGVLLYELGTMRRLFKRFNQLAIVKAITEDPIVPPSRVAPDFPARLEPICMRALARVPASRYATAAEMRKDLLAATRDMNGPDEPGDELARIMHDLFLDRMEEKRELLRKMRAGSDVTYVPAGETDEGVDVPGLDDALPTETTSSLDATPRPPRRTRLLLAVGAVALAAGAAGLVRVRADRTAMSAASPAPTPTPTPIPTPTPTPTPTSTPSVSPSQTPSAPPFAGRRRRPPSTAPTTPAAAPPPAPPPPAPTPDPAPSRSFHRFE